MLRDASRTNTIATNARPTVSRSGAAATRAASTTAKTAGSRAHPGPALWSRDYDMGNLQLAAFVDIVVVVVSFVTNQLAYMIFVHTACVMLPAIFDVTSIIAATANVNTTNMILVDSV